MSEISRREFTAQALGSLLSYSLLETVCRSEALAAEVQPIAARWIADLDQLAQDVRGQTLRQVEWQQKVEESSDAVGAVRLNPNARDPFVGANEPDSSIFEIPQPNGAPPIRVTGFGSFTHTRATAYCFMPSITGLRFIAKLGSNDG